MSIVTVDNLSKSFGANKALDNISLAIERGEVFGLLGPDGAGKTTLLRILAGVMTASGGKIDIMGRDVTADMDSAKQHIGYLSQRFSLYPDLTVAENIDFYSRLFGISKKDAAERKRRLLEFSRLDPYANRRARHLSGGMKQKLALTCALIHTPKVLLLDEPTTGVDPISRREFWKILYDLVAQQVTIIIATPYMDEAERANRVALLYKGRVLKCASPDSLRQEYPNRLAELVVDNSHLAKTLLEKQFGRENVVYFGDKLHLKLSDFDKDIAIARNLLEKADIQITLLEQIAPHLEDVFIDAIS
jgi:ABC-2 type transport system ATP-binding protein